MRTGLSRCGRSAHRSVRYRRCAARSAARPPAWPGAWPDRSPCRPHPVEPPTRPRFGKHFIEPGKISRPAGRRQARPARPRAADRGRPSPPPAHPANAASRTAPDRSRPNRPYPIGQMGGRPCQQQSPGRQGSNRPALGSRLRDPINAVAESRTGVCRPRSRNCASFTTDNRAPSPRKHAARGIEYNNRERRAGPDPFGAESRRATHAGAAKIATGYA